MGVHRSQRKFAALPWKLPLLALLPRKRKESSIEDAVKASMEAVEISMEVLQAYEVVEASVEL